MKSIIVLRYISDFALCGEVEPILATQQDIPPAPSTPTPPPPRQLDTGGRGGSWRLVATVTS